MEVLGKPDACAHCPEGDGLNEDTRRQVVEVALAANVETSDVSLFGVGIEERGQPLWSCRSSSAILQPALRV